MKKLTLIAIALIILSVMSCKKEESLILQMPTASDTAGYFRYSETNFMTSAHVTTGSLIVFGDKVSSPDTLLYFFKNFKTDDGPDLDVYVSQELNPVNFTNIGDIKAITGNFFYKRKATTDLTSSSFLIIWCVDFNVNFGYATLPN